MVYLLDEGNSVSGAAPQTPKSAQCDRYEVTEMPTVHELHPHGINQTAMNSHTV